jgi:hypothetical protein
MRKRTAPYSRSIGPSASTARALKMSACEPSHGESDSWRVRPPSSRESRMAIGVLLSRRGIPSINVTMRSKSAGFTG